MAPRIRLLGDFSVQDSAGQPIALPTRKAWALLAYLCQSRARDVSRESLAALLWPEVSEAQARASLRQELAVLRKSLARAGIGGIQSSKDRIAFQAPEGSVDTGEMEGLLKQESAQAWRAGVALYGGDFLRDLKVRARPFEEWHWIERQRLKSRVVAALQRLLERDLADKDTASALDTADRLLAIEPTQEPAYRAMMGLLRGMGRRSEALKLYRDCVDVLRRDLDAVPSLETTMLAEQIRDETGVAPDPSALAPRRMALVVVCLQVTGAAELETPPEAGQLALAQGRFQERVKRIVSAAGGTVLQGLGDRVVCVFGQDTNAVQAAEAAVQAALSLCAEPVTLSKQAVLWPRAALARSEVLVNLPLPGQYNGAVLVGDALLRSTALAFLAEAGQVVVTGAIGKQLSDAFELHALAAPERMPVGRAGVVRRARGGV